ncbi:sulfatase [Tamlana sp. 2201CG12-4]|uniref:sulfatase family protein n=1 Tax=Tamlana sp. 2201CG12-4 TaxID=3112582 RepID=UPI002DBA3B75|nr:sulfatase [Tamlana sp. 2201CG12-4]MEC3908406.1 sulfatase [Tamlana sp. 2201CG12-4]
MTGIYAQEKPNIIFLLSDDQTSIATGCYGNNQVVTPNMDLLAQEGIMFKNHYNTTAICMASRATIMTGMYEYKTGCNFMHGPLKPEKFQQSYPVILRNAGYFTGFAGKFGFAVTEGQDWSERNMSVIPKAAFDVWGGGPGQTQYETAKNKSIAHYAEKYPHSTRAYGAWANDFIKEAQKSGKPFCMSISFKAPHLPFTPDKYFDYVYKNKTYKKRPNYGKENAKYLSPQSKSGRQYNEYTFWRDSEESYQDAIKKYNQLIHGVDYALGMIRKSLKEFGVSDNTIIIFTSDNGYSCGAHSFGGKVLPYEEASKSPLIVYDPRLPETKRGKIIESVTGNIDIAPTIFDYAGIKVPNHMDGVNLRQIAKRSSDYKNRVITLTNMWGNDEIQEMAVVTKDWKYIYWQYADKHMEPTEELFNISNDKYEMENVANKRTHEKALKKMRSLYDQQYNYMIKNMTLDNDYEKYKVLFDRKAKVTDKKEFLTGTYKEKAKKKNF